MEKLSNIFLQAEDEEGGTSPSIKYWLNVKKVKYAFEIGDVDFFWSKSEDGGGRQLFSTVIILMVAAWYISF